MVAGLASATVLYAVTSGLLLVSLAAVVLAVEPRRLYHLALGSFLLLLGVYVASMPVKELAGDPAGVGLGWSVLRQGVLAWLYVPLACFASLYPARTGLLTRSWRTAAIVSFPAICASVALVAEPGLGGSAGRTSLTPASTAQGPVAALSIGLLAAALLYAIVRLIRLRRASQHAVERERTSWVLLGLAAWAAFHGAFSVTVHGTAVLQAIPHVADGWDPLLALAGSALVAGALTVTFDLHGDTHRTRLLPLAGISGLAAGAAFVPHLPELLILGVWQVIAAGIVAYGVLRYEPIWLGEPEPPTIGLSRGDACQKG